MLNTSSPPATSACLQPCPFCRETKRLYERFVPNTGCNVKFIACACGAHGPWADTGAGKSPSDEWNRRVALSTAECTSEDAACERAAAILRAEAERLEYPRTMVPQESEKIARRQNAFRTAAHYLDPESKERIAPSSKGVPEELFGYVAYFYCGCTDNDCRLCNTPPHLRHWHLDLRHAGIPTFAYPKAAPSATGGKENQ